jgi:hypothetical protein
MKVKFDNHGALVVEAENNTEMVALKAWRSDGGSMGVLTIEFDARLLSVTGLMNEKEVKDDSTRN